MAHPESGPLDNAYSAPASALTPAAPIAAARLRKASALLLAASVVFFGLAIGLATMGTRLPGTLAFVGSTVLALAGAWAGAAAGLRGVRSGTGGVLKSVALVFGNVMMTGLGAVAALLSTVSFTRGRQIRSAGKVLLPPVEHGDSWTGAGLSSTGPAHVVDVDDVPTRRALAAQWRENGRTEHASVAAFARLTLDLIALGAPPDLIADANRDALDEIRHAELCFGLARAIDGLCESPGAFPEAAHVRTLSGSRPLALARLAVDSLVDGALHEGVSARIVAKLGRRCEAPAIAAILKEIAADEGRHAHHGWDVVRWCLAEGGEPVARALEGAIFALPRSMVSPIPLGARDGSWECWGIMGEELEAAEYAATRADVERRVGEAIRALFISTRPGAFSAAGS
jgi:hypothetical protein